MQLPEKKFKAKKQGITVHDPKVSHPKVSHFFPFLFYNSPKMVPFG